MSLTKPYALLHDGNGGYYIKTPDGTETRWIPDLCAELNGLHAQLRKALKERDEARALCDEASRQRDGWRANAERLEARINARNDSNPEPSRLEIAARIMQGWAANPRFFYGYEAIALRTADALIAAAKEVQG